MNIRLIRILSVVILPLLFVACDVIGQDERIIPTETGSFKKPVVIIDFTGVACNNCPRAVEIINAMHSIAGEKIISVAMYPDCSFNHTEFDLRTPEATQYYEAFGDLQKILLPSGMVDFVKYNEDYIMDVDIWNSAVTSRITKDVEMEIVSSCSVKNIAENIEMEISSDINTQNLSEGSYSLVYWIIENKVIGTQNYYGDFIDDYEHNHILRASLNGLWGENISLSSSSSINKKANYSVAKDKIKDINNCEIVSLLINSDTKEIITACKTKVTN